MSSRRWSILPVMCCISASCTPPSTQQGGPSDEERVLDFVRSRILSGPVGRDTAIEVTTAFTDLNGDGVSEAVAYVSGDSVCGSWGCNTYILTRDRDSYRLVTQLTISWPPIRVFPTGSHGWRNLGVWVQGGGIQPGYEAELRFDGAAYPSNPAAERPSSKGARGEVLIDRAAAGTRLFD